VGPCSTADAPPEQVTGVSVFKSDLYAVIKWDPNTSAVITSYDIWRTANTHGYGYTKIATVTSNDSYGNKNIVYVDADIKYNTQYFYKIVATNTDVSGEFSNEASAVYVPSIADSDVQYPTRKNSNTSYFN